MSKRELSKIPVDELEEKNRQEEHKIANQNSNSSAAIIGNNSNSSRIITDVTLSSDIGVTTTFNDSLKTKLKALYKAQDTLPKLIDDERLQEQSLTKYYIKLQVLLKEAEEGARGAAAHDKVIGEKAAIEIENIFSQVDDAHPEAGKVLLLGGAGVGKTTLLHYMSYRWGVGVGSKSESNRALESRSSSDLDSSSHSDKLIAPEGLWGNKFDYVFRVRLKELLSEEWREDYEAYFEPPRDKLSFFIHHCLMLQRQELKQKIENIKIANPHKQLTRVQKEKLEEELSKEKQKLAAKIPTIDIEEVISSLKQDKVLLLLDGYDEVAHLAKGKGDFKDIMDSVFERQHVIMSSRPNALGGDIKGRFERTIESRGLDFEGIAKYIDLHFKDKNKNEDQSQDSSKLGEELKLFLTSNTQVRGICEVPINTALICLIWGDREVRERFTGNHDTPNMNTEFNIGTLYHEVIVWLGKRYLEKFEDRDPDNITEDNVLLSPEVKFLKTVAYDSFIKTGKLVSSKVINTHLGYLDIRKVNKFGLLKPDGEGREIVKQNHQFVHLTFHEYLSAYFLKEQLLGDKPEELEKAKKAAYFIATHRSEPKYLMTLKFLAGLVSNEQEEQGQQLVTRFWEAVTCNVDGVLELGVETKVTLLMHLLAQAKTHGKTAPRIPNLKTIEQLIDEVVLQDITKWGQQIIESGYISDKIVKTLISIMEQNEEVIPKQELSSSSSSQAKEQAKGQDEEEDKQDKERAAAPRVTNHNLELKVAAEIVTSLINNNEFGGREVIFKYLMTLVTAKDWQVQSIGLEKLKQLVDKTISQDALEEALKIIIPVVIDENLGKYATHLMVEIIDIILGIPNQSKELHGDSKANINVKEIAVSYLKEAIKVMPSIAGEVFKVLQELITIESSYKIKEVVAESFAEVLQIKPNLVNEAFKILNTLIMDYKIGYMVKGTAIYCILGIVKTELSLAEEVLETLRKFSIALSNTPYSKSVGEVGEINKSKFIEIIKIMQTKESFKVLKKSIAAPENKYFKDTITQGFIEIVKVTPSSVEAVFKILKMLVVDSESSYKIKEIIAEGIIEIVKVAPNFTEEALNILKVLIANPDASWDLRNHEYASNCLKKAAAKSFTEIIKATMPAREAFETLKGLIADPKTDYKIKEAYIESFAEIVAATMPAREAFETLKELIADSKTDYKVKEAAVMSLSRLMKAMPSLSREVLEILQELIASSKNSYKIKEAAAKSFTEIIKATMPAREAFETLKGLIADPKTDYKVKEAATKGLKELITGMQDDEALEILKSTLLDLKADYYFIPEKALVHLPKIITTIPAEKAFEALKRMLADPKASTHVKYEAANGLPAILKAMPSLAGEALKALKWLLVDEGVDYYGVKEATESFNKIVDGMPKQEVFKIIKELLADQEANKDYIKYAAVRGLGEVIKTMPNLAIEIFELFKDLMESSYSGRGDAPRVLLEVVKTMPNLAEEAFKLSKKLLGAIPNGAISAFAREVPAAAILPEIIKIMPSLALEALEAINGFLANPKNDSRYYEIAKINIGEIIKIVPDIARKHFESSKALLDNSESDEWSKSVAVENLVEIVIVMPSLAGEVFEILKDLIVNSEVDTVVRESAAKGLTTVMKTTPSIAIQFFEILKDLLYDSESDQWIEKAAVRNLIEVIKVIPTLAGETFKIFKALITSSEFSDGTKYSIAMCLSEVIKLMPEGKILEALNSLFVNTEDSIDDDNITKVRYEIGVNLAEIVKAITAKSALKILKGLLDNSYAKEWLEEGIIKSLGEIVKEGPSITVEVFEILKEFLSGGSTGYTERAVEVSLQIVIKAMSVEDAFKAIAFVLMTKEININEINKSVAIYSVIEVVKKVPSLAKNALENLKVFLVDSENSEDIKGAAINTLPTVIKAIPFNQAVDLLTDQIPEVREAAKKAILAKLGLPVKEEEIEQEKDSESEKDKKETETATLETLEKLDYTHAIPLLKIVSMTGGSGEDLDKGLNTLAKKVLKSLASNINETGIKWINDHFHDLPNSSEATSFLKSVYHKVLSHAEISGKLSDTEAEFIIKCIVGRGLTSIIIPREGKIIFEDTPYKLLESTEKLTEIVEAVLKQSEDSLAVQYRDHEPLFVNTGSALPVAAADIKDGSLVDSQELQSNSWKLSLMHLSNHKQEAPSKVFILLERRGDAGEHLLYKLSISEGKLHSQYYPLDPRSITTAFRKEIFGEMEYTHTKPKYYGSTSKITKVAGEALINQVKQAASIVGNTAGENFAGREYEALHRLVTNSFALVSDSANISLDASWYEYTKQNRTITFEKAILLKVDSAQVRRDSINIDMQDRQQIHSEQINVHTVQLTKHEQRLKVHSKAITDTKGVQNLLESVTEKMLEDIAEDKKLSVQEQAEMTREIKLLDQSVKGIVTKVDAQEPIIQEITSEMKDLLIRKGTDTKTFITLYKKVKGIEEQLTNPSIPKVSMLHQADDQEESDVIELQAKVITTPVSTSSSGQQDATRVTVLQNKNPITIKIQPKHSTEISDSNVITQGSNSLLITEQNIIKAQDPQDLIPVVPQPKPSSPCCIVMEINEIVYDNQILNDSRIQDLLRLAKEHAGMMGVNKLLDIGCNSIEFSKFQYLRQRLGDEGAIKYLFCTNSSNKLGIDGVERSMSAQYSADNSSGNTSNAEIASYGYALSGIGSGAGVSELLSVTVIGNITSGSTTSIMGFEEG